MDEYEDLRVTAELAPHVALLRVLKVTGNLTRAAAELGVPQPTASRRLATLTDLLGTPVTEPDGRGIRLTRAGVLLADAAERAQAELAHGVRRLREEVDPERGHIALGFLHLLGRSLVPGLLSEFRRDRPHIRFTLVQGSRQDIVGRLGSGELDLALVAPVADGPGLGSLPLTEQELFVAVPQGHRLAGNAHVRLGELEREVFVMLEHGYGLRQITDDLCAQAGFAPVVAFEGQESETVRGLVAAGMGVALLPKFEPGTPAGVVEVPLRPRVSRTVGFSWHGDRPLPPAVAAFRDHVRARAPLPPAPTSADGTGTGSAR
ncbi:LysR family transcriptional regulator [Prauserella halophila]|uniref:LysR family transcriptional regulator n=2 Tax=Prauserella halophila TaxID=185641 RepID=A0ABP4H0K0_9PSEU